MLCEKTPVTLSNSRSLRRGAAAAECRTVASCLAPHCNILWCLSNMRYISLHRVVCGEGRREGGVGATFGPCQHLWRSEAEQLSRAKPSPAQPRRAIRPRPQAVLVDKYALVPDGTGTGTARPCETTLL